MLERRNSVSRDQPPSLLLSFSKEDRSRKDTNREVSMVALSPLLCMATAGLGRVWKLWFYFSLRSGEGEWDQPPPEQVSRA